MSNEDKIKFKVEIPCEVCGGEGQMLLRIRGQEDSVDCFKCEGVGYFNYKLSLFALKNLLEGGTL